MAHTVKPTTRPWLLATAATAGIVLAQFIPTSKSASPSGPAPSGSTSSVSTLSTLFNVPVVGDLAPRLEASADIQNWRDAGQVQYFEEIRKGNEKLHQSYDAALKGMTDGTHHSEELLSWVQTNKDFLDSCGVELDVLKPGLTGPGKTEAEAKFKKDYAGYLKVPARSLPVPFPLYQQLQDLLEKYSANRKAMISVVDSHKGEFPILSKCKSEEPFLSQVLKLKPKVDLLDGVLGELKAVDEYIYPKGPQFVLGNLSLSASNSK